MPRLFASALLVAGLSQAALAQTTMQPNEPSTTQQNEPLDIGASSSESPAVNSAEAHVCWIQ